MAPRVLIAGFKHETNTFSKQPSDLDAYRTRALHVGAAEMRAAYTGTNTEIAGFMDACTKYDWDPVLAMAADATPGGKVTSEAFDTIAGHILRTIDEAGPLSAILLQLHGRWLHSVMTTAKVALLSLIRGKVGPDVPIGGHP